MNMKKITATLLCGAALVALTGCGDSVSVKVDDQFKQRAAYDGMIFQKGEVYQVSEDDIAKVKAIASEAKDVKTLFANSDLSQILNADTSFVENKKLKALVKDSMKKVETLQKESESKWSSHAEKITKEYEPKLTEAKSQLETAQTQYNKLISFYKDDAEKVSKLQAEQAVLNTEHDELISKYTQLIRKDIVDLKLPIRMRSSYRFTYNHRRSNDEVCKEYRGMNGFKLSGYCYYLKPAYKDLAQAPSYSEGIPLLKKYLENSNLQKANSNEVYAINKEIKNAKIIAENQLGVRAYIIESNYTNAQRNLTYQESSLARRLDDNSKQRYLAQIYRTELSNVREQFKSFVKAEAAETINNGHYESSDEYEADLPVNADLAHSVLVYQYKVENKVVVSFLRKFDVKEHIESEEPVILQEGRLTKDSFGAVDSVNDQLQTMLFGD